MLALKRNSRHINYARVREGNRKRFDGYFLYNKRHVWFYAEEINDSERVIVYLDETLKAEEESDLTMRIRNMEDKEKKLSGDEENLQERHSLCQNLSEKIGRRGLSDNEEQG